jgi:branched-chain amino acid transport system ATP-binding protein
LLSAVDLDAGYQRIPVIHGVNMEVGAGEVVCLLGANGAGKTTTLLALVGELPPLAGEVGWLGRVARSPLHQRYREGLAFVPEERSVVPTLSVAQNLRLGRGTIEEAAELAPELVGLMGRKAGLLSGGEQRILTVARALASKPRLIVADELSLGLAPLIVERVLETLRSAADHGVGVLIVEQHVPSALAVSDRAYVLRGGRVVMEGSSTELADRLSEIESNYLAAMGGDHEQ